ncbi:steroidogenic acute regulatory protein, mitochondrial-like [Dysidea avara]|uniref:steroidogenic acute regulatory protein, mitochondrial-like n=1 Tax=Dysidea avara TaxID=196820 RepID=UPI003331B30D
MAAGKDKRIVDVNEFEKIREQVIKDEIGADWKLAKSFEHTTVYRRTDTDNRDSIFKFVSKLVGVPVEDGVKLVTDIPLRSRYDKAFTEIKVLDDHKDYKTVYWYVPLPTPCSDRDLVQHIKVLDDETTRTSFVVALPATHPSAPERPKVVRAETKMSMSILRPDEDDSNSCILTTIAQTDMKGLIPEFVINYALIKSGDDWRNAMVTFYHDVYVKEKQ